MADQRWKRMSRTIMTETPETVAAFLIEFQEAISGIPADQLRDAIVAIREDEMDEETHRLVLEWKRPETDFERSVREHSERQAAEAKEEAERSIYERLKAKFEPEATKP